MKQRPAWLAPLGVAFVVRLACLLLLPQRVPAADDHFYWTTAQTLAGGQGFLLQGSPTVAWMPGLPLLLAPLVTVFGANLFPARLLLTLLSVLTVPLVWRLAQRWFGDPAAKVTAWAFALFPPFWFYAAALFTESAAILLLVAILLLIHEQQTEFRWKRALAIGLCYGALIYFKNEFVLWGGVLGVVALVRPRLVRIETAAVVLLVGAVMLAPWAYRNWRVFGEFIPLRPVAGTVLWWVSHEPPIETWTGERTPEQAAAERSLRVPGNPAATDRNFGKAGWERIRDNPWPFLRRSFDRRLPKLFFGSQTEAADALGLARTYSDLRAHSEYALLALKLLMLALQSAIALLGIAGILLVRDPIVPRFLFVVSVGSYMVTLGIPRYSMALMPLLIPFGAALALTQLLPRARALRARVRSDVTSS